MAQNRSPANLTWERRSATQQNCNAVIVGTLVSASGVLVGSAAEQAGRYG